MNSADSPTSVRPGSRAKVIVWVVLGVLVVAGIIGYFVAQSSNAPDPTPEAASEAEVVREDSQVLSQAEDEQAVLVEFLDFECEACAAAYPLVEELRTEYQDEVTFVHRYFPLPGHPNSMTAAIAAEAAAQQNAYEAMYQQLFETQSEWGHNAEDQSAEFRGYAEELDLDMEAYDEAVADPTTQERIEADIADGEALGVAGTPTFFLDGEPLPVDSEEQFRAELDDATSN